MSAPQKSSIRNQLLAGLPAEDFAALQPRMEPVELELRQVLIEPNQPIAHVYFPERGYTAITANTNGSKIEVGLIGREGMVGVPIALGVRATPFEFFVQHAGDGLRMASHQLEEVIDERRADCLDRQFDPRSRLGMPSAGGHIQPGLPVLQQGR